MLYRSDLEKQASEGFAVINFDMSPMTRMVAQIAPCRSLIFNSWNDR
jgi:hypothetical protein